ncbi:MAG: ATP-binding protein [Candidatus Binatus sp.]|uniref:AAA family ATPase n=1 Tax=Candidatus Binatus sp. TaxID=2811406 RepID=UPI003C73A4E3
MKNQVVQTANFRAFASGASGAIGRAPGLPGIVLCHGFAGTGKTTITANLALKQRAIYLTALPIWSASWMLGKICEEMGEKPGSQLAPMFEFIAKSLAKFSRPIYVNEADALLSERKGLLETLRILHDMTAVPLVLIGGTAEFRGKVMRRPQIERRVLREVDFKPSTLDDSRLLAAELAEVRIAEDLVEAIHRKTRGSAGLFVKELSAMEGFCHRRGLNKIALADYPMDDSTPTPPVNRRSDLAAAA